MDWLPSRAAPVFSISFLSTVDAYRSVSEESARTLTTVDNWVAVDAFFAGRRGMRVRPNGTLIGRIEGKVREPRYRPIAGGRRGITEAAHLLLDSSCSTIGPDGVRMRAAKRTG